MILPQLLASIAASRQLLSSGGNTAHTYWRIRIITVVSSGNDAGLAQIQMFGYAGANLCTGGTAIGGNTWNSGYPPTNLFDGNPGTEWFGVMPDCWAGYQFASPVAINTVKIQGTLNYVEDSPASWVLEYSDDGLTWVSGNVSMNSSNTWGPGEWRQGTVAGATPNYSGSGYGAHDYWRIYIAYTTSNLWPQLSQMEFLNYAGGINQATGGTPSANSVYSTYVAANAFDGNATDYWVENSWAPGWLQYQFASPVAVGAVSFTASSGAVQNSGSAPTVFAVQFSDDGSLWTTAWCVSVASATSGENRVFADPLYVT